MGRKSRFAIGCAALAVILICVEGCTISIQPWSKPVAVAPAPPDGMPPGMVPVGPQNPLLTKGGPAPMPTAPGTNEALSQLIKQYNEAEDHRKALLEQVNALKKQVKDRDEKLHHASYEMEESTQKIKRTRDEFRQWEGEMTELRERVRKLEDNRRAVGSLIEEILNHLDRPREPLKLPSFDRSQK